MSWPLVDQAQAFCCVERYKSRDISQWDRLYVGGIRPNAEKEHASWLDGSHRQQGCLAMVHNFIATALHQPSLTYRLLLDVFAQLVVIL